MIDKKYRLLDMTFKIANCNYLVIGTHGTGKPSEAMDTILNLSNGVSKTIKRYDLKELFKTYKAMPNNWDAIKINDEYKQFINNRNKINYDKKG